MSLVFDDYSLKLIIILRYLSTSNRSEYLGNTIENEISCNLNSYGALYTRQKHAI